VAELVLEPYAVVQRWHLPGADGHWEAILAEYLQTLAQRCSASRQTVIGHIKTLALFSDQGYLRISVVAPNRPASIEGKTPPGCIDLELTLNVLVYGLERTEIERITHAAANEVANRWKGVVDHNRNQSQPSHPSQHSHHHDQKESNDE
jgi:hypothetical protein